VKTLHVYAGKVNKAFREKSIRDRRNNKVQSSKFIRKISRKHAFGHNNIQVIEH